MVSKKANNETERLMHEGQAAAKRGDKAMARALLTQLLEHDPHNEDAWVWLSGAVADPVEQQTCLENALIINPANEQARKGLDFVSKKTGILPRIPALAATAALSDTNGSVISSQVMGRQTNSLETQAPAQAIPEAPPLPWTQGNVSIPAPVQEAPVLAEFSLPDPGSGQLPPWETPGVGPTIATAPEGAAPLEAAPPEPPPAPPLAVSEPQPGAEAFAPPADVAPFEAPVQPEAPTYTGGPPTEGAPPDTSAAVPDWVKGLSPAAALEQTVPTAEATPDTSDAHDDAHDAYHAQESEAAQTAQDASDGDSPHTEMAFEPAEKGAAAAELADMPAIAPFDPLAAGLGLEDLPDLDHFSDPNWATDNGSASTHASENGTAAHQEHPGALAADPFAGNAFDSHSMDPFSSAALPLPSELPGSHGSHDSHMDMGSHVEMAAAASAQPWYASQTTSATLDMPPGYMDPMGADGYGYGAESEVSTMLNSQPLVMMPCPHCKQQVPDTSMICPECEYTFFVHCPHCHELIDTSDAVAGRVDPCPYCGSHISKMDLGLMNSQGVISSQLSDPVETKLSWEGVGLAEPRKRFRLSFGWVADLFVLVVIILMVWVLAQLPVWFNWTHLYY